MNYLNVFFVISHTVFDVLKIILKTKQDSIRAALAKTATISPLRYISFLRFDIIILLETKLP